MAGIDECRFPVEVAMELYVARSVLLSRSLASHPIPRDEQPAPRKPGHTLRHWLQLLARVLTSLHSRLGRL
ncbi:hypothetical protein [Magnetospirillum sp. UT-4]|uniref:hypothetical protein n=1 Tax=Magnetospirillum sp. UT-4 TaxID=2681467 RepID=UPI00138529FA|nr:hypothetical protein [Magnetospirillum sp. UT-4]CAA7623539.1 hypothetical protein MTBUT4_500003 [Magnetospirillum sp. UT-4]